MAEADHEDSRVQTEPPASPQQAWATGEEAKLEQIEQATESDEDREARITARSDSWGPFRREAHNKAVQQVEFDQMEVGLEKQVEGEIASGKIAVPAGGPLTPKEIHEAEIHPWPGHSMEETVARMRSGQSGQPGPEGDARAPSG
jgi:hypothetical protein